MSCGKPVVFLESLPSACPVEADATDTEFVADAVFVPAAAHIQKLKAGPSLLCGESRSYLRAARMTKEEFVLGLRQNREVVVLHSVGRIDHVLAVTARRQQARVEVIILPPTNVVPVQRVTFHAELRRLIRVVT